MWILDREGHRLAYFRPNGIFEWERYTLSRGHYTCGVHVSTQCPGDTVVKELVYCTPQYTKLEGILVAQDGTQARRTNRIKTVGMINRHHQLVAATWSEPDGEPAQKAARQVLDHLKSRGYHPAGLVIEARYYGIGIRRGDADYTLCGWYELAD